MNFLHNLCDVVRVLFNEMFQIRQRGFAVRHDSVPDPFSVIIFSLGVLSGVCTRVRYFVICVRNSSSIGRGSVSCCRAAVDVVLKHPVIAFMASHHTVER